MAPEDRDRNFEKAMARELRSDALNGLDCPDAETLAAYHERLLSTAEMAAHKSHIAACARCREILSTLELTDTISAESDEAQTAVAARAQKVLAPLQATPVFPKPAAPSDQSLSKMRQKPGAKPSLRWAVPAGAIAAGLLVWVAVNHNWNERKAALQDSKAVEVAENRKQNEPALTAPNAAAAPQQPVSRTVKKGDLEEKSTPQPDYDDLVSDGRGAVRGKIQSHSARNLPHGPSVLQNQAQNQIQNNSNYIDNYDRQSQTRDSAAVGGALAKELPALPAPNAPGRSEEARKAAPPPVAAGTGARKDAAVAAATEQVDVTAATPTPSKPAAKKEKAAAGAAGGQNLGLASDTKAVAAARLPDKDALGELIVWTPDPQVFWVIQKNGNLMKSENGGKSSVAQNLGAGVKALAGSAPDAKTCWVLAQGRVVFRTVDGGRHWSRVSIPSSAGFSTIVATDGEHASISDPLSQLKLATTDGGATWGSAEPK